MNSSDPIVEIKLNYEQWSAFIAILDRPTRKLPRLEKLMREPSILDAATTPQVSS
jgi:uncharacterized protein (DUF1778 family)